MVEYTERLCAEWAEGETVDVHSEMMGLTLEIIAKTLFDADGRAAESEGGSALSVVMDHAESLQGTVIPPSIPAPANRRYARAIATLEEVVSGIIEDRRRADDGEDVVSMLVAPPSRVEGGWRAKPPPPTGSEAKAGLVRGRQ